LKSWEIILSFLLGLVVNEACDVSPWLARRIIVLAARHWSSDKASADAYAEEWLAIIHERPGKIFKLATALSFAGGALCRNLSVKVSRRLGRFQRTWLAIDHLARKALVLSFLFALSAMAVGGTSGLVALWLYLISAQMALTGIAFILDGLRVSTRLNSKWRR